MLIRKGTPADADRIAALHTASRRSAYATLMPAAVSTWTICTCAQTGSAPARPVRGAGPYRYAAPPRGATSPHRPAHAAEPHIDTASPRLQRSARHPGRDVFLEVLRGNDRAIVFYEHQGGLRTAERPLRLAPGLVLDEVEYTWPAAQVGLLAEDGPQV